MSTIVFLFAPHRKYRFWKIKLKWNTNSGDFIRPWRWSVFCLRPKNSKWKMFSSKIKKKNNLYIGYDKAFCYYNAISVCIL